MFINRLWVSSIIELMDEIENEFKDTTEIEVLRIANVIRESFLERFMNNVLTGNTLNIEDCEINKLKDLLANIYLNGSNYDICLKLSEFIDDIIASKQKDIYLKYRNISFREHSE